MEVKIYNGKWSCRVGGGGLLVPTCVEGMPQSAVLGPTAAGKQAG